MYKKLKYNLMLVLLIAVIGIFLGATSVLSGVSDGSLSPDIGDETEVDEGQGQMPTGKFVPPSATASAFTRIAFGFKVLKEGDGFESEIVQTIISMGQVQNIYSKSLRAGITDYSEEWQYSNISFAKNEFVSKYSNGTNVRTNIIKNSSKFSVEAKSYEQGFADVRLQSPARDFVARVGNFNDFPLTINNKTSSLSRYDKLTDKNNYVITVSFNPSMVDSTYLQLLQDNGTQGVSFKEITITFKINKTTGFFSSIAKNEKFNTVYAGIPVSCDANMSIRFLKTNTSMKAEIDKKVAKNFK